MILKSHKPALRMVIVPLISFLMAPISEAKDLTDGEIVSQNPPPGVAQQIARSRRTTVHNTFPELQTHYVRVKWPTGQQKQMDDYLVALYAVGYLPDAFVRVFRLEKDNQFEVAYDLPYAVDGTVGRRLLEGYSRNPLSDFDPIFAKDVDGDGVPEIFLTMVAERCCNFGRWVLKWNGTELKVMTPYEKYPRALSAQPGILGVSDIEDLSGDGRIDILLQESFSGSGHDEDDKPLDDVWSVYRVVGEKYQNQESLSYYRTFAPGEPTGWYPNPWDHFQVADPTKKHVLQVVQGHPANPKGGLIEITFNGKPLSAKGQPIHVGKIPQSFPIDVKKVNQILVKVPGEKGSGRIVVTVVEEP